MRRSPARAASRAAPLLVALGLLAALGLVALAGCNGSDTLPTEPSPPSVPEYTLDELRAAPEDLKIGGVSFTADVTLSRNFQPMAPADGDPLVARAVVTAVGESAYPTTVTAAYVWVLNGSSVWASWMRSEGAPPTPNARVYAADGGPKWGPLIDVDVVIGLRTSPTTVHLLFIPAVPIDRLE